jgi:hypothetical protein
MLYRKKPKNANLVFRFGFGRLDHKLADEIMEQSKLHTLKEA